MSNYNNDQLIELEADIADLRADRDRLRGLLADVADAVCATGDHRQWFGALSKIVDFRRTADQPAAAPTTERPPNWPIQSFQAMDWADEFVRLNPTFDHGTALAWFASALMRGFDEAHWRTSPPAAPAADAAVALSPAQLDQANVGLAAESARLQEALSFYAERRHIQFTDDAEKARWESGSDPEAPNWLARAGLDLMIEDGGVAREALKPFAAPPVAPEWCHIHQHYKWCGHNGGVMGATGYEAPDAAPADDAQPDVCQHGIRSPWACHECDEAAWAAKQAADDAAAARDDARDAARYRWLRDYAFPSHQSPFVTSGEDYGFGPEILNRGSLDAAIDTARAADNQGVGP